MARRYQQKTYMEAERGFFGTILGILKWVILAVIIVAVIAAVV